MPRRRVPDDSTQSTLSFVRVQSDPGDTLLQNRLLSYATLVPQGANPRSYDREPVIDDLRARLERVRAAVSKTGERS